MNVLFVFVCLFVCVCCFCFLLFPFIGRDMSLSVLISILDLQTSAKDALSLKEYQNKSIRYYVVLCKTYF